MSTTLADIPLVPRIIKLAHEHGSTENLIVHGEPTMVLLFNSLIDGKRFIETLHTRGWDSYFRPTREIRAGYCFVWLRWIEPKEEA